MSAILMAQQDAAACVDSGDTQGALDVWTRFADGSYDRPEAFVEWLGAIMREKLPDLSEDEVRRLAEATASKVDDRAAFLRAYEADSA